LALGGGKWSASHFGCFIPGEKFPGIHWVGGWGGGGHSWSGCCLP